MQATSVKIGHATCEMLRSVSNHLARVLRPCRWGKYQWSSIPKSLIRQSFDHQRVLEAIEELVLDEQRSDKQ